MARLDDNQGTASAAIHQKALFERCPSHEQPTLLRDKFTKDNGIGAPSDVSFGSCAPGPWTIPSTGSNMIYF